MPSWNTVNTQIFREMVRNKERLKQQIVASKYFKEHDPRFLTYEEKERICMLHESDPDKWSIEKLSESFPALPETIQQVLHSKWLPKSVESVVRYDSLAVKNWKKFRAEKLAVSPALRKHLMKFKDRKIVMTDRELLAKKFVLPKPEFKKPTKQLFSSIVQGYLNEQQNDTKLSSKKDDPRSMSEIFSSSNEYRDSLATSAMIDDNPVPTKDSEQLTINRKKNLMLRLRSDSHENSIAPYDANSNNKKNRNTNRLLTFNEFVKAGLKDPSKLSPEESATLLEAHKDQINANEERQTTEVATASNKAVISAEKDSAVSEYEDCDSDIAVSDNLMDTRIKAWKKKVDTEGNYLKPIKIAKSIYKPGMTYRISDCYYDDDGEFLYRVPGIQS